MKLRQKLRFYKTNKDRNEGVIKLAFHTEVQCPIELTKTEVRI